MTNERQVLQHSALVQGGDDGRQCSCSSSPEPSTTCADVGRNPQPPNLKGMKVDSGLSRKGTGKVEQCTTSLLDGCVEGDTEAARDGGMKQIEVLFCKSRRVVCLLIYFTAYMTDTHTTPCIYSDHCNIVRLKSCYDINAIGVMHKYRYPHRDTWSCQNIRRLRSTFSDLQGRND